MHCPSLFPFIGGLFFKPPVPPFSSTSLPGCVDSVLSEYAPTPPSSPPLFPLPPLGEREQLRGGFLGIVHNQGYETVDCARSLLLHTAGYYEKEGRERLGAVPHLPQHIVGMDALSYCSLFILSPFLTPCLSNIIFASSSSLSFLLSFIHFLLLFSSFSSLHQLAYSSPKTSYTSMKKKVKAPCPL